MYFHTLFHPHVIPQEFLNNNFQFLNTCTKQALKLFDIYQKVSSNNPEFKMIITQVCGQ